MARLCIIRSLLRGEILGLACRVGPPQEVAIAITDLFPLLSSIRCEQHIDLQVPFIQINSQDGFAKFILYTSSWHTDGSVLFFCY